MNNDYKPRNGIGFCRALTIAFIVLRLCHIIDWSWLIVLLPAQVKVAIILAIFIVSVIAELSD
ncbi:hypothetical protein [Sharpea azabuensis]|uniref:hypothetical protein n=1 Tax=Sharpea azabuensis TaxID=322505 RepID=UPI00193392E1|nr:hypothetical protein [Sharpea azabuensis]